MKTSNEEFQEDVWLAMNEDIYEEPPEHQLLVNMIKTPDGTILESRHRHDYNTYLDTTTGIMYNVDGGLVYLTPWGSYSWKGVENLSVYDNSPHDLIRERFSWGSFGKCGTKAKFYIKLKDMSDAHIQAIIDTQHHISDVMVVMFFNELKYREDNDCSVVDV